MHSIRNRLFLILIITTGIVWLSASGWIYLSTKSQIEHVLDARLMEAARMVNSLMNSQNIKAAGAKDITTDAVLDFKPHSNYNRYLSCQIWTLDGALVSKSAGAPQKELGLGQNGFSETVINGEVWRVFAVENTELGVRVVVGDNLKVRAGLISSVIKGLLLPALLIMPILAALIWFSVGRGLLPLRKIAGDLAEREAADLSPIDEAHVAGEISPVINSLNDLFKRVADARERERNFTAFAAHELRTPLAGLKTQAQVALASNDVTVREQALRQVVIGADRTGRLMRQLLDIASIDIGDNFTKYTQFNVGEVLQSIEDELLASGRHPVTIEVEAELFKLHLRINPDMFRLAVRNLMENAIHHSPQGSVIRCGLTRIDAAIELYFDDEGPGVREAELPHLTERFFRGSHKAVIGSGLGLSIAEAASVQIKCTLKFCNRTDGGFRAAIILPQEFVVTQTT